MSKTKNLFLIGVLFIVTLIFTNNSIFASDDVSILIDNNLFGGSSYEKFHSVVGTSDGGYIAVGYSNSSSSGNITDVNRGADDGLIVKFNINNEVEWTKLFGGSGNDYLISVVETADGGYLAAGSSYSSEEGDITDINNGTRDGLLVKFDSNGNVEWDNLIGGTSYDYFLGLTKTSDGGYLALGNSRSSQSGEINSINNGNIDAFVVKVDKNGNVEWDNLIGSSKGDYFYSANETVDGGYLLFGRSSASEEGDITDVGNGKDDALIVKIDSSGNVEWDDLIGGNDNDYFHASTSTSDGGYLAVGFSNSLASGDITDTRTDASNGFVVKFDSTGNMEWNKLIGGIGFDYFTSVIEMSDGNLLLAGESVASENGDITDVNNGGSDGFIVKIDNYGNILWNKLIGGLGYDYFISLSELNDNRIVLVGQSTSSESGDITDVSNGAEEGLIIVISMAYDVIFDINGGDTLAPESQLIQQGTYISEPPEPSKENYIFTGWNTNVDGSGLIWDFAANVMPSNDVTLYAQWEINKFTVTYDSNGGSSVPDEIVDFDALINKPEDPIKEGNSFVEWNTKADGSGEEWIFESNRMPKEDITLYAIWLEDEDVIDGGDGSIIDGGNTIDNGNNGDKVDNNGDTANKLPETGQYILMLTGFSVVVIGIIILITLKLKRKK